MGYPDQAVQRCKESLALANELSHPFTIAWALHHTAITYQMRRDRGPALQHERMALELATEQEFPFWIAQAKITCGGEIVREGQVEEGLQSIEQGLAMHRAMGADIGSTYWLSLRAEAYAKKGLQEQSLQSLDEALALLKKSKEMLWEADLYRLKGDIRVVRISVRKYTLRGFRLV